MHTQIFSLTFAIFCVFQVPCQILTRPWFILSVVTRPNFQVQSTNETKQCAEKLSFFPNSKSSRVFSHSKGFGAKLLSDSLWFSGADPTWAAKTFRGRFHQGSPNLFLSLVLGQIRLGLPKGSAQGSAKVPPRLRKFSPRFHQGSPNFVLSLVLRGRSVLGCQKGPRKVPPRFHQGKGPVARTRPLRAISTAVAGCHTKSPTCLTVLTSRSVANPQHPTAHATHRLRIATITGDSRSLKPETIAGTAGLSCLHPTSRHDCFWFFSETISKRFSIEIRLHFFNQMNLKLDPNQLNALC